MNRFFSRILFLTLFVVTGFHVKSLHASFAEHLHTKGCLSCFTYSGISWPRNLMSLYSVGSPLTQGRDLFSMDLVTLNHIRKAIDRNTTEPDPERIYGLSPLFAVHLEDDTQTLMEEDPAFAFKYSPPEPDCYGGGVGVTFKNGISLDIAFSYLTDIEYIENDSSGQSTILSDWCKSIYNPFTGLELLLQRDIMISSFKVSFPL